MNPAAMPIHPARMSLNTNTAPSAIMKSDAEPMMGQGIGCGTE
jgi:hypothetical protein